MMETTKTKMAYKFRVYPSRRQQTILRMWLHDCWWFYRYALHNFEDDYNFAKFSYLENFAWYGHKTTNLKIPNEYYYLGKPITHQGGGKKTTGISTSDYEFVKLARVILKNKHRGNNIEVDIPPAVMLQEVLERVNNARVKFFKGEGGYPKYPKERNYSSMTWTSSDSIILYDEQGKVKLPGIGVLNLVYHRPIRGKIKRVNVSIDILGNWHVSLMCEFEKEINALPIVPDPKIIGVDMNIRGINNNERYFITLSDGKKINKPISNAEQLIAYWNTRLSKYNYNTQEYKLISRKIKHIRERDSNKKEWWLHDITTTLKNNYDYVVIEDMDLRDFHIKRENPSEVSNSVLKGDRTKRKAWTDNSFSEFVRMLSYKMGDHLIKVNPAYTSKTCNKCGNVNNELTSESSWICPKCGVVHDRDINAAKNILARGVTEIKEQQENGCVKKTKKKALLGKRKKIGC